MTLYEIATQYNEILSLDCDDDDTRAAMVNALDAIDGEFTDKVENVIRFIRNCEAEAGAIREEEKRLAAKRQGLERKAEKLTAYIEAMMVMVGKKEVQAGIFTAKFRQNPPSISVLDESALGDRFWITVRTVSKTEIKKALASGEAVPGIEIIRNERLEIK